MVLDGTEWSWMELNGAGWNRMVLMPLGLVLPKIHFNFGNPIVI
ncbi:hypothetical protein C812_00761 [Paenibacillus barengoltzii G22]|uniref:Uncharacterized protein n=1 Tax=Paenibacillus barengoltzii G22 TaxID=1235795 RepID=R9LH77_9BACL|nr:hypothetical protein C812_00761 [Paenibacillus barengoltzii G22]